MFCFISLRPSLISPSPCPPTNELAACASCCLLWRLDPGAPARGAELVPEVQGRACCWVDAGCLQHSSTWCQVQTLTSQDGEGALFSPATLSQLFFPAASQVSLNSHARMMPLHEVYACVHPSPDRTQPTHPFQSVQSSWLVRQARHALLLGAAACFAVRGFMTCYISSFNESWVGANGFTKFYAAVRGTVGFLDGELMCLFVAEGGLGL